MRLNKIWSVLLIISLNHCVCYANSSYQEILDQKYRYDRQREEREYVRQLELGGEPIKPYINKQYDRAHNYESLLGYE